MNVYNTVIMQCVYVLYNACLQICTVSHPSLVNAVFLYLTVQLQQNEGFSPVLNV